MQALNIQHILSHYFTTKILIFRYNNELKSIFLDIYCPALTFQSYKNRFSPKKYSGFYATKLEYFRCTHKK